MDDHLIQATRAEQAMLAAQDGDAIAESYIDARHHLFEALGAAARAGRGDREIEIRDLIEALERRYASRFAEPEWARLCEYRVRAEQAYTAMYDRPLQANGHYSDAKAFLADATGAARRLGLEKEALRLEARAAQVRDAFRRQFP